MSWADELGPVEVARDDVEVGADRVKGHEDPSGGLVEDPGRPIVGGPGAEGEGDRPTHGDA